mmetsp:Transcript_2977/g.7606  ORF Transcript_2977/g.7606 Transcript_2977/m.7606 type:complete len:402 (-) Transcript_2977:21-1226(-)
MPRLGFACMCLLACCVNGVDHVEYAVSQNGEGKAPVIRRSLAVHWDGEVREHGQHTDHSTQESDAATGHLSSRGSKRSARGELKVNLLQQQGQSHLGKLSTVQKLLGVGATLVVVGGGAFVFIKHKQASQAESNAGQLVTHCACGRAYENEDENECPACGRSRVVAEAATMAGSIEDVTLDPTVGDLAGTAHCLAADITERTTKRKSGLALPSEVLQGAATAAVPSCPQCRIAFGDGANFCMICGTKRPAVVEVCDLCRTPFAEGANFCMKCGNSRPGRQRIELLTSPTSGDLSPTSPSNSRAKKSKPRIRRVGLTFRDDETGEEVTLKFLKKPLGLTFREDEPTVVSHFPPDSQAEAMGLRIHMRLIAVEGTPLMNTDASNVFNILECCAKSLPRYNPGE